MIWRVLWTRWPPAGCDRFVVHARIAVFAGLSPRENRTIPPLRYADVYQLKTDYPHLRHRDQWWHQHLGAY